MQIPTILDPKFLDAKQVEALCHLSTVKNAIVWWRVGEGKSRIAIFWTFFASGPRDAGEPVMPLIICSPNAFRTWQDEISLLGLERSNFYPFFFSFGMLSKKHKFADRRSSILNRELERKNFVPNCVIVDELWLYKNPRSIRSLHIQGITSSLPCIGLSGSMMTAKNIEDLYGQASAVGLGNQLANNLTNFRSQFCIEVKQYGITQRYPKKGAVQTIQSRIAENIHCYFPKERKEIREVSIKVDPTLAQVKLEHELVKEYYYQTLSNDKFELEIKNKVSLLTKLLQISDGFLADSNGNYISVESNKLYTLISNLSELINSGERAIVWFAFKKSLQEAARMAPFKTVLLSGDSQFDDQAWRRGKIRVCFATIGSGSSVNDFANVGYSVLYSSSFSFRAVQQAKGRTNRKSTINSILYYYYYQTVGFPDQYVYDTVDVSERWENTTINITRKIVENWLSEKSIWASL